jgi:hypothetical protein
VIRPATSVSGRFVEDRHSICGCDQEAQAVKACDQPGRCAAIDAAHFFLPTKPVSAILKAIIGMIFGSRRRDRRCRP